MTVGARSRSRATASAFDGGRVDVDQVPRLPTFPARWTLNDPRGRSYFVFWADADGTLVRALLMAPADDGQAVAGVTRNGSRLRLTPERRRQWGGEVLFYLCPVAAAPPTPVSVAGDRRAPGPRPRATVPAV